MEAPVDGLDWEAIEAAERADRPFEHVIVRQALRPAAAAAIPREFPTIARPGSFSLADAVPGPTLQRVIDELCSDRFRRQMERIFDLDLEGRPTLVTLRGQCGPRDGRTHTDSRSKIISLLLYLNEGWVSPQGQLRLLDDEGGLDAPVVEVPAGLGTMVAFARSDHSWHGHTPFVGPRRVLQFNYLRWAPASMIGDLRHRVSALGKRLVAG